jgi:omega-amidase
MKVAISQLRCVSGDVAKNLLSMHRDIEAASAAGCGLILFPEMSDTGYHMPTILETASPWDRGPVVELASAAKRYGMHIIAGVSERDGADIFNSTAVIDPQGHIAAKYRKVHLITAEPVCEHHFLKPGDTFTLCRVGEFQVGVLTCYDIRFPEMARKLTLQGADVLIIPSAFPLIRCKHWKTITSCRAIENQVYVLAANRVGTDHGLSFCGNSRLLDPYGTILTSASEIDETLLFGEITSSRISEVRGRMKVFQDRRENLY